MILLDPGMNWGQYFDVEFIGDDCAILYSIGCFHLHDDTRKCDRPHDGTCMVQGDRMTYNGKSYLVEIR